MPITNKAVNKHKLKLWGVTKHEYISIDYVSCMIIIHGNLKRTFDIHIPIFRFVYLAWNYLDVNEHISLFYFHFLQYTK